ncbi:MAG: type II/IV secretion system protein [Clostridiaceae bacterium]|nr:type II/IV secretion system protein [Clostridiaceae bacterium]
MNLKFEEILIQESLISSQQMVSLKNLQKTNGKALTEILISQGTINKKTIISILEKKFNVSFIDLDSTEINYLATESIPKEISVKYCAFAYQLKGKVLSVVMADPLNVEAIDAIKFVTGKEIKAYFGVADQITTLIDKYYDRQTTENVLKNFKIEKIIINSNIETTEEVKDAPVVKIVDYIINQAVVGKASDIHIEPFEEVVIVRLRIDGILTELIELPVNIHTMVSTRVKIMSNMETSEKRIPQDGKFQSFVKNLNYDFRVSIIPTIFGEKIVIRILYKNGVEMNFQALGIRKNNILIINEILKHSSGMVLITGPTGSGKSTTLYSMLNHLNKKDKNIITIEDPVEYFLQGVNQINVNPKIGLSFSSGLRSILRQDPDIIMVGEIRDTETAEMAVRAAITGHLVISTLHTKDAAGSISRLKDMGVPYYLLADSLIAVLAQRLVRKICPYCKKEYLPSETELKHLGKNSHLFIGTGCNKCGFTGYSGRTAIYEIMYMDEVYRKIIATSGDVDEIRENSLVKGMTSLKDECLYLLVNGITTLEEYMKFAYDY